MVFEYTKWIKDINKLLVRDGEEWYKFCIPIKSSISSVQNKNEYRHAGYAYSGPTAGWAYKYLKKY